MKDCYAVHLIRWFNALPEKDTRKRWKRLLHRFWKIDYRTKESFFSTNQENLCRHLVDSRHAWTRKELGYE